MKWITFLFLLLIYTQGSIAEPVQRKIVVQSYAITELYGQSLVKSLGVSDVIFLEHNPRSRDVDVVLARYLKSRSIDNVMALGSTFDFGVSNVKYAPLLSQLALSDSLFNLPIYLISSNSEPALERAAKIKAQLKNVSETKVGSDYELRTAISTLAEQPVGFIFLNVFHFQDSWGKYHSFKDAEKVLVEVNRKHVEVGICYTGFKTALAIGPTPDEVAGLLLEGTTTKSVCASMPRLRKLGKIEVYAQHKGGFNRVVAPDY